MANYRLLLNAARRQHPNGEVMMAFLDILKMNSVESFGRGRG